MSEINVKKIDYRIKIAVVAIILAFSVLIGSLFNIQVLNYDNYKEKVINNITRETTVKSTRGTIYDTNGVTLAENVSVERVFISPVDIKDENEKKLISEKLSEILEVDYDEIYTKAGKVKRQDETIKKNVEKEDADKVRAFIAEYNLTSVHLVTGTKRYYPFSNLASHILGFTGTDGQGLYGIEYQYNDYLTGTDGKIITAKNGVGMNMPYSYENYIEASNGLNLVLTIDYKVQSILENYLEECIEETQAANRVTAIITDVNTGGILAMATKPDFDCNAPYTLDEASQKILIESGLGDETEDYSKLKSELLMKMWSNKGVTDLYEPGSTFKIITSAVAFDTGAVKPTDQFYCPGYHMVEGYPKPIKCHRTWGHGSETYAEGLMNSCNPVLMMTAERIGKERFYEYYQAFGYTEKTGIDLPGESGSVFHQFSDFHQTELAVYSFGQTFKITPIQQITGISCVANGGTLLTPHIVKQIVDDDGNVIVDFEANLNTKRQVVSSESAQEVLDILEQGVSGGYGSKNAYVAGYKVAAKTGTSEKRDKADANGEYSLRIASCTSIAPSDDAQIAMLLIVDEPTIHETSGAMIAAPYNSKVLSEVLPYLGIEPTYTDEELNEKEVNISNYVDMNIDDAKSSIKALGIKVEVEGDGDTVVSQVPAQGSSVKKSGGRVILYTDEDSTEQTVTVPDVIGKTVGDTNNKLINSGLNISISGSIISDSSESTKTVKQYPEAGMVVPKGSVVTVEFRHYDDIAD